uniref:DUF4283 domain-containing protein n=1 Tax=Cannabis sativa TaxID=3483 RepID=A0A803PCI4_CANSA
MKSNAKKKKKGPSSSIDVKKTKSMDEVLGVEPIDFSDEEEEQSLEDQRANPSTRCSEEVARGVQITPPVLRSGNVVRNLSTSFDNTKASSQVKITLDDIHEEVNFWNLSLVCYILGANPPLTVLDGFVRRLWKDKIDKVGLLSYGIFFIRFYEVADRDSVLNGGHIFFNKRPVIMKAWDPNVDFKKEDVSRVLVWITMDDLELKYWGENSLFKIIGQVGAPIMVDAVIKERDKLSYPRVLIEVSIHQDFPHTIYFENEFGNTVPAKVTYEWKSILCKNCKGMGHETADCRKREGKPQEWLIKMDSNKTEGSAGGKPPNKEFIQVRNGWKLKEKEPPTHTETTNTFTVVEQADATDMAARGNLYKLFITFVYGFNDENGRKVLWNDLRSISSQELWVIFGDFNDILSKDERIGDKARVGTSTTFLDCVNDCQIHMLKAVVVFSLGVISNMQVTESIPRLIGGKKPFKYFCMWSYHPSYHMEVKKIREEKIVGSKMCQVVSKLKALKIFFRKFNRDHYSDIQAAERKAKQELDEIQGLLHQNMLDVNLQKQEQEARELYGKIRKDYCSFLQQKSRISWLKEGDENSALFHSSIRERRICNSILSICDTAGKRMEEPYEITNAFLMFYQNLLGSKIENRRTVVTKLITQGACVTEQDTQIFKAPYTLDEVKEDVFSISVTKAPGPDGYNSSFYQDN